jgi:putative phosphoribosyl transferase
VTVSPETVTNDSAGDPRLFDDEVEVTAGKVSVAGHLTIPEHPTGIVVFAHGSGSRYSPRSRYVASVLNRAGGAQSESSSDAAGPQR